jgi:hypothetical protein
MIVFLCLLLYGSGYSQNIPLNKLLSFSGDIFANVAEKIIEFGWEFRGQFTDSVETQVRWSYKLDANTEKAKAWLYCYKDLNSDTIWRVSMNILHSEYLKYFKELSIHGYKKLSTFVYEGNLYSCFRKTAAKFYLSVELVSSLPKKGEEKQINQYEIYISMEKNY